MQVLHTLRCRTLVSLALYGVALIPLAARATDPLGFYIGAGIGRSHLNLDQFPSGSVAPTNFDKNGTGWKLIAGLRPLPVVGAELEYFDFGHASATLSGGVTATSSGVPANAKENGAALFGLAYLPLPIPLVDVYAKAGVARVRSVGYTAAVGSVGVDICYFTPTLLGCKAFSDNRQSTGFAWGGGAQLKLSAFALRAEYERFSSAGGGHPDLLSIALTWGF